MTTDVAVVTQDEPLYMPLFFRSFFADLDDAVDVRWVTILDTFDEPFLDTVRRAYGLYGPVNFPRVGIRFVARTVADRLGIARWSVASEARANGVGVDRRETVNDDAFVDELEDVDVLLSVSAPEIFEPRVLDAPSWGCLNVHTSELPRYRGLLPTFWALYHGEEEIGVTVHTMVEEIDRGEIVRQTTFPVGSDPTLDDVIARGKREGGALAAAALADVAGGTVTLDPMTGEGSYHSFPTVQQRREFQRRGGKLL